MAIHDKTRLWLLVEGGLLLQIMQGCRGDGDRRVVAIIIRHTDYAFVVVGFGSGHVTDGGSFGGMDRDLEFLRGGKWLNSVGGLLFVC